MKIEVEVDIPKGVYEKDAEYRTPTKGEPYLCALTGHIVKCEEETHGIRRIVLRKIPREFWVGEYPDGRIGPVTYRSEKEAVLNNPASMKLLKARVVE